MSINCLRCISFKIIPNIVWSHFFCNLPLTCFPKQIWLWRLLLLSLSGLVFGFRHCPSLMLHPKDSESFLNKKVWNFNKINMYIVFDFDALTNVFTAYTDLLFDNFKKLWRPTVYMLLITVIAFDIFLSELRCNTYPPVEASSGLFRVSFFFFKAILRYSVKLAKWCMMTP